jgi:hypothetical protein
MTGPKGGGFARLSGGEVFEPLRTLTPFGRFGLIGDETVVWENGADMAPEYLYNRMTVIA